MNQTKTESNEIQIYMADLAAYNCGVLHGRWIDATQGADGIWEEIQEMLAQTPLKYEIAEEHAIHDQNGFGSLELHEYESIETVAEYAEFIEEHGKLGSMLLVEFDIEEATAMMSDRYLGEYESVEDYAEQLLDDCYEIPKYLEGYIDYQKFARDLELSGDIESYELSYRKVHIFCRA